MTRRLAFAAVHNQAGVTLKELAPTYSGPAAGVVDGHLLRCINRGERVCTERMSEKVVWRLLQPYTAAAGVPGIAPHDLRRSCAKMCRAAGGELEQIRMLLGHSSVQTTEGHLVTKQDLVHAPNDGTKLWVAV
ncbi:MAG: site-specific integrase [Bryobacteraceae bacterium]